MPNHNVTHHTGWEQVLPIPHNIGTNGSSSTFLLPYQARALSIQWTAGTAGTGTGTLIIGTSNGTSNIVSAVSLSNSTNTSLTVIDQTIDAGQLVTVTSGECTDGASVGGMLTFFIEIDKNGHLS